MKPNNHPKFKYAFLGIDICVITIAFFLSLHLTTPNFWSYCVEHLYFFFNHFILYLIFLAIFIISFRYNNLYKRNVVITHHRHFILILKAMLGGIIACVLFMVISNIDYFAQSGKSILMYFFIISFGPFIIVRVLLGRKIFRLLVKNKIQQRNILIVGGDIAGKHVAESLRKDPFSDFQIVGFLDDYKDIDANIFKDFNNLGKLDNLEALIKEREVDEILVAIDHAPYERLIYIVEKCLQTGKYVRIYSDLVQVVAEKLDVEYYANIPVIELSQLPLDGPKWSDKRVADIIVSSLALVLLSPLFLVIVLGIKLFSKGPAIFKQERIGKDGKRFNFYKFRSMHTGADDLRHKEFVTDFIKTKINFKLDDIQVFKITDDPRIFKFGKFLRKSSLDEFPQFFNVLKGEMTLVGPRPCLPYEWECYEEWHKNRLNSLPGCTGLWQALGRSSVTFEEMVILDLYYISNMTLWLDLKIVLQTIPVIFFAKGGH